MNKLTTVYTTYPLQSKKTGFAVAVAVETAGVTAVVVQLIFAAAQFFAATAAAAFQADAVAPLRASRPSAHFPMSCVPH